MLTVTRREVCNGLVRNIYLHLCLRICSNSGEQLLLECLTNHNGKDETVEKVIADNPQSVADYKAGKDKAIGFLVGQTMKAMQGKANPGMVNQLLKELLK